MQRHLDSLFTVLHGLWTKFARFLIAVGMLVAVCGQLLLYALTASISLIILATVFGQATLAKLQLRLSNAYRDL